MSKVDIASIRKRLVGISPAPWNVFEYRSMDVDMIDVDSDKYGSGDSVDNADRYSILDDPNMEDAQFIAHAREDVPALCDEVERLRKLVKSAYEDGFTWVTGEDDHCLEAAQVSWEGSFSKEELGDE